MKIYVVQGGIGKHVMFSSLINKLCELNEEKIIVVSAYPDLFKFHPKVEKSATFDTPGFYDEYIKNTDNMIIHREPYISDYVKGNTHLIEQWAKLLGVEYNNDLPDIYVDDFAVEEAERFIKDFPDFILVQFSGGQSPLMIDRNIPFISQGQIRDYPRELAQEVVDKLKKVYPKYSIINYALPNEGTYNLEGCEHLESPYLFYVCLLKYCKTYVCIDSSLQHFAAELHNEKKGIVIWGSTDPKCLGYEKNINISNTKKHPMRPLCSSIGDVRKKDGSDWINEDVKCTHVSPNTIIKHVKECVKINDKIKPSLDNIVKNEDIIEVNEKTRNMLFGIEHQLNELNNKYQTIIDTYVASKDKEGKYSITQNGKKLIKME